MINIGLIVLALSFNQEDQKIILMKLEALCEILET